MDTQQQLLTPHQSPTSAPAQLWIGDNTVLEKKVIEHLQRVLCVTGGDDGCSSCRQIEQKQHHAVTWCSPENQHTLETIQPIFETIPYILAQGTQHFFIITHADFLSNVCANKLLKSIEEPPQGYHFILLAQQLEQITSTIQSRCRLTTIRQDSNTPQTIHPLLEHFFSNAHVSPISFVKTLESSGIAERETTELLDQLMQHCTQSYKITQDTAEKTVIQKRIETLIKSYQQLPMPGGSIMFWRNLFLQWNF